MDSTVQAGSGAGDAKRAAEVKRAAAKETLDILEEISVLLNTNLTRQQLTYCVSMIENGVNPEALADVIRELKTQANQHEGQAQ